MVSIAKLASVNSTFLHLIEKNKFLSPKLHIELTDLTIFIDDLENPEENLVLPYENGKSHNIINGLLNKKKKKGIFESKHMSRVDWNVGKLDLEELNKLYVFIRSAHLPVGFAYPISSRKGIAKIQTNRARGEQKHDEKVFFCHLRNEVRLTDAKFGESK